MPEWQPIETAPEDVSFLAWSTPSGLLEPKWGCASVHGTHFRGWWTDTHPSEPRRVTHWMPLPDAPATEDKNA